MSGFVPMRSDWWAVVRTTIPRPWPREAAAMDLRYHADRATPREGWRPIAMPGRPALASEWGWTDWAVKQLLRAEDDWRDSYASAASEPPANRQRTASEPPAAATANAYNQPKTASEPPARRQRTASEPPRARSSDHPTPITQEGEGDTRGPTGGAVVDPRLAEVVGTRPDLLRLLVRPLDPKDPPIRDLAELRRTPLSAADGPDLVHRTGMGPQRAGQLAALLDEAGVPLVAVRPPEATGAPARASPAADNRKRGLAALDAALANLNAGDRLAVP